MRKTSVYLSELEATRLARLARQAGVSQAKILRDAITAYTPAGTADRDFSVAAGFTRTDADARPVSELSEAELLAGFGG